MPLGRSTKERKSTVPDDYIIFFEEHEMDIGVMEDDLTNSHQVMANFNSQKWIDAMNEEIKLITDKILYHFQKVENILVTSGDLKQRGIQKAIWKV